MHRIPEKKLVQQTGRELVSGSAQAQHYLWFNITFNFWTTMKPKIERHSNNPIIRPGGHLKWRQAITFNPAALYDDGKFYLYERAAGTLRPSHCYIGGLVSDDGINFKHFSDEPVLTPEMCGSKYGSVQDPRTVKIEDTYYMTFAFRPYAWSSNPTGLGVPESKQSEFPGVSFSDEENQTRSGIAISEDRINWKFHSWTSGTDIDDRNNILFPEKINGKFALLRRPQRFVGLQTEHDPTPPCIQISYSDDLVEWSEPSVVAPPKYSWENNRIGGSTPPIKTPYGWLTTYHGVENQDESVRRVCYRMGLMLLDLDDPTKVIARCPDFIMEPEEYYEKVGLYIPNVIFPTAGVVVDGIIHFYYGCCDTSIGLATVSLQELVDYVLEFKE